MPYNATGYRKLSDRQSSKEVPDHRYTADGLRIQFCSQPKRVVSLKRSERYSSTVSVGRNKIQPIDRTRVVQIGSASGTLYREHIYNSRLVPVAQYSDANGWEPLQLWNQHERSVFTDLPIPDVTDFEPIKPEPLPSLKQGLWGSGRSKRQKRAKKYRKQ